MQGRTITLDYNTALTAFNLLNDTHTVVETLVLRKNSSDPKMNKRLEKLNKVLSTIQSKL
jgi:hypothetical protein